MLQIPLPLFLQPSIARAVLGAVDVKTACTILFGVMQLVKVSWVGEGLCYDELVMGSCTGTSREGCEQYL